MIVRFLWGVLTVDGKGDFGFPDSDPRDDGLAYVLAGIGLADGLQIQLVAVTQNLLGRENGTNKAHIYRNTEEPNPNRAGCLDII